jgi:hypothetical protein
MEPNNKLMLAPSSWWTRVLLTHGPDELLRAVLPSPSQVRHERAATSFVESLALWLDAALPVVLSVTDRDAPCCLGLTDELGVGRQSIYYRVEVNAPAARRRGSRLRGVGDFGDLHQLRLVPRDER